jgi:hypothetical protein
MRESFLFFAVFFLLILNLSFVSSNFVCGFVNNSQDFSSSWGNVRVYYQENPQDFTECKINPENKFCCALEEIKSVTFGVGKIIFAEVFDKETGYVAGPVNLSSTEEGYDIFPLMNMKKAIIINSPEKRIFINESSILMNISLAEGYPNLKYSLNSSENSSQGIICENCHNPEFFLKLFKGKNTLRLTAYGQREISEEIEIYSLDYFDIKDSFQCPRCINNGEKVLVPSNTTINLRISFNSSHEISGDLLTYFPIDWIIDNFSAVEDYSETHKLISSPISGSSGEIVYSFKTPKTLLNRKDSFKYEFADLSIPKEVLVYRFFRYLPFHSSKKFSNIIYFKNSLNQIISPTEPLVLVSENSPLDMVAIYPKAKMQGVFAYLNQDKQKAFKKNEYSFSIFTNLQSSKIDTILFRFKCPKDKILGFYDSSIAIPLQKYNEDKDYLYFEAYYSSKGNFKIKVL